MRRNEGSPRIKLVIRYSVGQNWLIIREKKTVDANNSVLLINSVYTIQNKTYTCPVTVNNWWAWLSLDGGLGGRGLGMRYSAVSKKINKSSIVEDEGKCLVKHCTLHKGRLFKNYV